MILNRDIINRSVPETLELSMVNGRWRLGFGNSQGTEDKVDVIKYFNTRYGQDPDQDKVMFDQLASAGSSNKTKCAVWLWESLADDSRVEVISDLVRAEFRKCSGKKDPEEIQGALLREQSLAVSMMVRHIKSTFNSDSVCCEALESLRLLTEQQSLELDNSKFKQETTEAIKKYLNAKASRDHGEVEEEFLTGRRSEIIHLVNNILEKVLKETAASTDSSIKKIFNQLHGICGDFFPEYDNLSYQQIVGIYFLRIINPAIIASPILTEIDDTDHQSRFKQAALTIAKILQLTASEIDGGGEKNKHLAFALLGSDYGLRKKIVRQIVSNLTIVPEKQSK